MLVDSSNSALEHASLWGILSFSYLNPILQKGSEHPLQLDDLSTADRPENLHKCTPQDNKRLVSTLLGLYVKRWMIGHVLSLGVLAGTPFVVRKLVAYFSGSGNVWEGLVYASVLIVLNQISSTANVNRFYHVCNALEIF
jgi:hypothetical protein